MSRASLVVLVLVVSMATPSFAQDAEPGDAAERELHVIGETSVRAVALLEQLVANRSEELDLRRLQVAVLALQLRSNTIGNIEGRIQTLQDRATEAREYSTQLESELERIGGLMTADTTSDEERIQLESTRAQMEGQIELAQRRIWDLERRILDLENDLAAKRRDVETLEEIVMEGLSGF